MNLDVWEKYYEKCPRFDEGEIYKSPEYNEAFIRYVEAKRALADMLTDENKKLLDQFEESVFQINEQECKHYFMKGFAMGSQG